MVDALNGRGSQLGESRQARSTDTIVVIAVNALAEGLGRVSAGQDAWEWLNKTPLAVEATEPAALHDESGIPAKAFEMTRSSPVAPLAVEAAASTARACLGPCLNWLH